jgi:hypothetical protein
MPQDFFIPDNFEKPPTYKREQEGLICESAALSAGWIAEFATKFRQPAIGFKKGSRAWQQRAVKAWSRVAHEWRGLEFPESKNILAALSAATGLSLEMLAEGIRNHFSHLDEATLLDWLQRVRQERHGAPYELTTDYPELVFLVTAGNIPGVAIHPVIQLSLLGIPTLVKNASAEPFLLPAIFNSLACHDPEVAARTAALTWSRQDSAITETVLALKPQLVIFGDDGTIAHFAEKNTGLADFGDRFSLAIVSQEAVDSQLLQNLAYDLCMFEQQGCLSPQAILLLTSEWDKVENFCTQLAEEIKKMTERLPLGRRTPAQQAAIQQWRGALAARRAAGEKVILLTSAGTEWSVAAAEQFDLNDRVAHRFARVWQAPSIEKALSILNEYEPQLQAVVWGITANEERLVRQHFTKDDAYSFRRLCQTRAGYLQKPAFGWLDLNPSWFRLTRGFKK